MERDDPDNYACPNCPYVCSSETELITHMEQVHEKRKPKSGSGAKKQKKRLKNKGKKGKKGKKAAKKPLSPQEQAKRAKKSLEQKKRVKRLLDADHPPEPIIEIPLGDSPEEKEEADPQSIKIREDAAKKSGGTLEGARSMNNLEEQARDMKKKYNQDI